MSSAQSEEELNKFLRGHRVLQMGLAFYRSHRISIKGLIHHSDRGSQYASSMYTDLLFCALKTKNFVFSLPFYD